MNKEEEESWKKYQEVWNKGKKVKVYPIAVAELEETITYFQIKVVGLAVKAEREACAKLVEEISDKSWDMIGLGEETAKAIRARGDKE